MSSPRRQSFSKKTQHSSSGKQSVDIGSAGESHNYDIEQNVIKILHSSENLIPSSTPYKPCINHKDEDGLYCPPNKPGRSMCMKCAFIYVMVNFNDNDALINNYELMKKRLLNSYYKSLITNHSNIESHEKSINDLTAKLHEDYENLQITVNQTYKECKNALKSMFKNSTKDVLKRFVQKHQILEQFKEFLHQNKDSLASSIKEIENGYEKILFNTNRSTFDRLTANFQRKVVIIKKTLERKESFAESVKLTDKVHRGFLENFYQMLDSISNSIFFFKDHQAYDKFLMSELKRHKSLQELEKNSNSSKKVNPFLKNKDIQTHIDAETISKPFHKHSDNINENLKQGNIDFQGNAKNEKMNYSENDDTDPSILKKYASDARFDRRQSLNPEHRHIQQNQQMRQSQKLVSSRNRKKHLPQIEEEKTPPPKQKSSKWEINMKAMDQISLILTKNDNGKIHRQQYLIPSTLNNFFSQDTTKEYQNTKSNLSESDSPKYDNSENMSAGENQLESLNKNDFLHQGSLITFKSQSVNLSQDNLEQDRIYEMLSNTKALRNMWDCSTFKKKAEIEMGSKEELPRYSSSNQQNHSIGPEFQGKQKFENPPRPSNEDQRIKEKDKSESDKSRVTKHLKRVPSFGGDGSFGNLASAFRTQEIDSKSTYYCQNHNSSSDFRIGSKICSDSRIENTKALNSSTGVDKFISNRSALYFKRMSQYNRNRLKYTVEVPNRPVVDNCSPFGAFSKISPNGTTNSPLNKSSFNSVKKENPNDNSEKSKHLFKLLKERFREKHTTQLLTSSSTRTIKNTHEDQESKHLNDQTEKSTSVYGTSLKLKQPPITKEKIESVSNGRPLSRPVKESQRETANDSLQHNVINSEVPKEDCKTANHKKFPKNLSTEHSSHKHTSVIESKMHSEERCVCGGIIKGAQTLHKDHYLKSPDHFP
jgi:hypothetical protein